MGERAETLEVCTPALAPGVDAHSHDHGVETTRPPMRPLMQVAAIHSQPASFTKPIQSMGWADVV
jgi:hypothetical protein